MDHLDIVKRLCDNNCDTYIVGGGIRDMLLGKDPDDFDVVTEATPDQVIELFQDCKVKQVGKSFGVILVEGYEIATFRTDRWKDSKCIVTFAKTIHDDLSRRDLTVNAMAYCELTGEIIDDHGGQEDLENRIIKFVGDPDVRIDDDPDRMIRACRFKAKIDGEFEEETFKSLKRNALKYRIAPERIRLEIIKAMKIKKASIFFEALHSIGMLNSILPSLDSCWKHEHGPHHTEDIFDHCMYAGDIISTDDPILKLTGYLHDVGKPASFKDSKFINHEVIGRNLLRDELQELTFSTKEIDRICGLVRSHMNAVMEMKPKGVRRLLRKFNDRGVDVDDFLTLRKADRAANIARPNFTDEQWDAMELKLKTEYKQELPFNSHSLVYSGGDIIKDFALKPGPNISLIQNYMLEHVIENGSGYNKKEILKQIAEYFIITYLPSE